MPKTDPEIITLGAVGTVTVTAPSALDGATVQSIEGGTVTRAGGALAGGETLYAGETLTFTPATAGGTTYLNARVDNAEFSGHYDDLDGKPEGTGATGPAGRGIASIIVSGGHLTGTYSDGTAWDAGALPAGSGGGLDAEAVQDIVGQMLGETQGHYDDAAGTYTINLPAGSSMTDEQVQDIVGALIQAGSNVTVAYDDAGNTLTVSAAGGAGGGLTVVTHDSSLSGDGTPESPLRVAPGGTLPLLYLSVADAIGPRTPPIVSDVANPANLYVAVWNMTPQADVELAGLRDLSTLSPSYQYRAIVWQRGVTSAPLAVGTVITGGGTGSSRFDAPVRLLSGTQYFIGWSTDDAPHEIRVAATVPTYARITLGEQRYGNASQGYPSLIADWTSSYPAFELLTLENKKGVVGPLDPIDFPIGNPATAAAKSGFMVVDDAARTASLYWKFSDGSTKKVDLT